MRVQGEKKVEAQEWDGVRWALKLGRRGSNGRANNSEPNLCNKKRESTVWGMFKSGGTSKMTRALGVGC